MLKMLLGAAIFGLAISFFYLGVGYLAFTVGVTISSRNVVLDWLKTRKTWWGNLVLISAVFLVLSAALYIFYFIIQGFGRSFGLGFAIFVGFLTVDLTCEIILVHFGISKFPARTAGLIAASAAFYFWFQYHNWVTTDLIALTLAGFLLLAYKRITLTQSLLVGVAVIIYDIVAVFGTGVMIKLVTSLTTAEPNANLSTASGSLPILFSVPANFSSSAPALFILGLGDIVIPGFIIIAVTRESVRLQKKLLAVGAYLGYVAGAICAVLVLRLTNSAQPATIYLIPGVVFGFMLAALCCGKIKEIFIPGPK